MRTELTTWQIRHGITPAALNELLGILMPSTDTPAGASAKSESYVQSQVRLAASQAGMRLWRNNVGAGTLENGSYVRWGLCNDTPQLNKIIKSSDLIGIRSITVQPSHVGSIIGQFVARECKHGAWRYTGDEREVAQLKFINLVRSLGGDAAFTTGNL